MSKKQEDKPKIRVSVRNFVEFLMRTGDIDNRRGNLNPNDAMLAGSRIHRKIQQSMEGSYRAEVALKLCLEEEEFSFALEGRADGIIEDDDGAMIDEIKGVYQELSQIKEPVPVHEGQAKCYAYIYAGMQQLSHIRVQMTYCSLDTEDILRFENDYSYEELEQWFLSLYEEYKKWIYFRIEARKVRQDSIKPLKFPFPYREGQEQLVKDVYRSILREKRLFIQAPTGVGKTMCTVFPAVKAVGEDLAEQIFYLTAKTITRTAAKDAFALLQEMGYRGRVLTITAKEKMCPLEEMSCNPVDCPYAVGYFDRVNDAVYEWIQRDGIYDRTDILEFAKEKQLCPFEFSLDVSLWCDVVICDYNYVFDPNVYLKRFFADGIRGDYIFLVDEAHNLVERARNMYSAVLYKEDFLEMKRLMNPCSKRVTKALESCNKILLEYKRECETYRVLETFSPFIFALMRLSGELDRFFTEHPGFEGGDNFRDFYFALRHFLNMCDIMDEHYVTYTQHDEDGRFMIKLYCVNPSGVLQSREKMARSTVFFSATLLPVNYYREMLSEDEEPYAVYAKTAFHREQSRIYVATDVSSKYTRRNDKEYEHIAAYIRTVTEAKRGNYLVFFPSYRFMQQVYDKLMETDPDAQKRYLMQNSNMTEQMREEFLENFREDPEEGVTGLCVMGGIFSEGIDLTNDRLIGAVIVGTGLPQISNEREILKQFFEKEGKNGFDHAFRYPGMNKVQQAAGRVIRTMEDKGVILLLDERFLQRENRELFPREWEGFETCRLSTIEEQLRQFWEEQPRPVG